MKEKLQTKSTIFGLFGREGIRGKVWRIEMNEHEKTNPATHSHTPYTFKQPSTHNLNETIR